ncbi:MAG: 50S ribosomal protein L6 [Legionellales bacterium]|nr:50S ribosomal protein L6 [Legionellales bacterium]
MSRIADQPINIPKGVDVNIKEQCIMVKGSKGVLEHNVHPFIAVTKNDDGSQLNVSVSKKSESTAEALSGTTRALVNNMVVGVSDGFSKSLDLVGVGYRAQLKGKTIDLNLGFSHPVEYALPEGITAEMPSNTNIIIKGIDKQKVGQVAAEIRAIRPPEPYKGKGVKYSDEKIIRKEAKKK